MVKLISKSITLLLLPLAVVVLWQVVAPHHVSAQTIFNYTDHLMDDLVFRSNNTMGQADIQTFLQKQSSGLAGFSDTEVCGNDSRGAMMATYAPYFSCGTQQLASKIIYDSSQAYGINPQVLLATMQKEQSLVTTPNPTTSQLSYAMGYGCPDSGSCSYPGFATQVEWAAWQFRYDYEAINGNSYGGWTASSYPCQGSPNHSWTYVDSSGVTHHYYYSYPLITGNNVTFWDDYGNAYTSFTLPNASTASLYCYTPHVYPGSSQEYYSGSYWFVYYYNLWFTPYAWNYAGQGGYVDSAHTQPYNRMNGTISIAPGATAYLEVKARNNGYETWTQSVEHLGTSNPQDRCSVFANASWISCQRIAMTNTSVAPGDTATFDFSITAPSTPGSYREYFNVVADGYTWLNDPGLYFNIDVVNPLSATNVINTLTAGQSLSAGQYLESTDTHSIFAFQNNGALTLLNDFRSVWQVGNGTAATGQLIMQNDGNLVFYAKDSKGNLTPVWNTQTQNNPGAYFVIQPDGNAVIYSSAGKALWATYTNGFPANGLTYIDHSIAASYLYPMQQLRTASGKYWLVFQPDGNLVLYSATRALWSSQTNGKPAAVVAMQGDGNLVIYDKSFNPLWTSNTGGQGFSNLIMQDDGNLVIYNNAGKPTWNTQTNGLQ